MSRHVRLGVIGLGNIGKTYVNLILDGAVERAQLAAVSSRGAADDFGVPHFSDYRDLLRTDVADAVLIASPTMSHTEMGILAAERGLHLLMDKPLAMSVAQAQSVIERVQPNRRCAVMLNQRFHPAYRAMRAIIEGGGIGELMRYSWLMTAWYRPDVYYQVSSWRGTWPGEGGGLVINQCIHNLDVLQWLTGLPDSVSAIAGFGKYHEIGVEDEFTATLQHDSGVTGVVVASSGEAPGVNQLDIVGDRGMLRFDGDTLTHWSAEGSVREHCRETSDMFGMPQFDVQTVDVNARVGGAAVADNQHAHVLQNFVDSILDDVPLLTPASEGLASLHLANGILLSAWEGQPIRLPLDATRYEAKLSERISAGKLRTPSDRAVSIDMNKSFR